GAFADKHVGTAKPVAISGISLVGADAGNYTLADTTAATTADITSAPISAVTGITAASRVYDATTTATLDTAGAAFSGRFGSDDLAVATASGAFADKHVGTAKPVAISGITLSGTDAGNYTLADTTAATTADITPATLTPSFGSFDKIYDGSTTATASVTDNRIGSDALTLSYNANFSDRHAAAGKLVTVNGISLSGADAGNYSLAATSGSHSANIAQRTSVNWIGGSAGNWSTAANWSGSAIPDRNNVAAVDLGSAAVSYDYSSAQADAAVLNSLAGTGSLTLAGGTLTINEGRLAISTWLQNAGNLRGTGGLTISQSMTMNGPGTIDIGGPVNITHSGNLQLSGITTANALSATATGGIRLSSALVSLGNVGLAATGGLLELAYPLSGANVALAGATIDVLAPVSASADLILGGNAVNLNASVAAQNIALGAGTLNIGPGAGLAAGNSLAAAVTGNASIDGGYVRTGNGELKMLVGGDLMMGNGGYIHGGYNNSVPYPDVRILVGGSLKLNNGAHVDASNDAFIGLQGAQSMLVLNDGTPGQTPSYVLSDRGTGVPSTTYLNFLNRSSGGIVIDGVETTATVPGGSGFYLVNTGTPAVPGSGLAISYAVQPSDSGTETQQVIKDIQKAAETGSVVESPTESDQPPPPEAPRSDPTQPPQDPTATTGGTEGSFGSEADTGATTNGDQTPSETKKAEKDEKDKKDKKDQESEEAKKDKKDEGPPQKKVAHCT
ncbi:MAG: YDG domain-containing protein, partial [Sulfuritalea sp.]|nr:YDG domain-containing protein [Sulfuritalea sp.]